MGKTSRYYFKVNPGKNRVFDVNVGIHHLVTEDGEDGKKEYYVDDSWMISLNDGKARKETYDQEK